MKRLLLCLLLAGCANHYYGIGLATTDEINTSYSTTVHHRSLGIGVFVPSDDTYYGCFGYTEIYIKNVDVNKITKILRQEQEIVHE